MATSVLDLAPREQAQPEAQCRQRPLRIAMVSARFQPLVGGTETHVYEVGRRLAARGHEVAVLTTDPGDDVPSREIIDGVRVIRVPTLLSNLDLYIAPQIYDFVTARDWDVVHCQGYHTFVAPAAMLAARQHDIPYVVTFHSGGHSSRLRVLARPVQWRMLRPLIARADRLVGVSEFEADHFSRELDIPRDDFTVILNGADSVARIPDSARQAAVDHTLIVSPGRLERYKGHQRVIEALPHVAKVYPDVQLRIAGAGPYGHKLRELAHELGVGGRVQIARVPHDDREGMARLLGSADVVTALSDYEAYPIAVLEALTCGSKVLVADTSGLAQFGRYPPVRTIPPGSSPEAVAAAIIERIDAPEMTAEFELPTWEGCTAELEQLYYEIAAERQCVS